MTQILLHSVVPVLLTHPRIVIEKYLPCSQYFDSKQKILTKSIKGGFTTKNQSKTSLMDESSVF